VNQTKQDATQFDGVTQQVTVIDPSHPLFGRSFPLARDSSPRGKTQLLIQLPNGLRRSIPRSATDFDPSPQKSLKLSNISVRTILPVARFVQILLQAAEEAGHDRPSDTSSASPKTGGSDPTRRVDFGGEFVGSVKCSTTNPNSPTTREFDPTDENERPSGENQP
jgi:hypothetical protein